MHNFNNLESPWPKDHGRSVFFLEETEGFIARINEKVLIPAKSVGVFNHHVSGTGYCSVYIYSISDFPIRVREINITFGSCPVNL